MIKFIRPMTQDENPGGRWSNIFSNDVLVSCQQRLRNEKRQVKMNHHLPKSFNLILQIKTVH